MKTIKFLIILSIFFLYACDEKEFLKEVPLSFYSPENSFVSYQDFEAGIIELHSNFRFYFPGTAGENQYNMYSPMVLGMVCSDLISYDAALANLPAALTPYTQQIYDYIWRPAYIIIYNANVIIERSASEFSELTAAQRILIQAEARFFRGYMHKFLADIFGGVPIVLEETKEPKRDYVRASRSEVYEQCVADLKFAAENLPGISATPDHRLNELAAYHALAEAYISLGDWDEAIDATSIVINDPNTELMTQRFGTRINDPFNTDFPWASGGDVYWDLFRKGNQNRSAGNKEAIWVVQFAYNVPGGLDGGMRIELRFNPRNWMARVKDSNGTLRNLIPFPNTYYGGRAAGQTRPNDYVYNEIWLKSGWDHDIRNSEHNLIRDVKVNNPVSEHHGKWLFRDSVPNNITDPRDWFPIFAKNCSMGDHPKELWNPNQTVAGSLLTNVGPPNTVFRDVYQIRLAETYLIRAEAYIKNNDLIKAAKDINVVRNRSNAPDVDPSEVDIDYLLDERARELIYEENRLQTLARMGLLVERTNRFNTLFKLLPHQNLFPIPNSEIEKNTAAKLEQNPGYED